MAAGLSLLIAGGTCLPLVDNTSREPQAGETLGVAISTPAADRTVAQGTPVEIKWSASNLTGNPATVAVLVESRVDLSRTALLEGLQLAGTGDSGTLTWDTQGFAGLYAVIGRIETADLQREHTAAGKITVDTAPVFEFTAPTGDVVFDPGANQPLTIAWTGEDETATARIGLDPDTDHDNDNEIFIHEVDLSDQDAASYIEWEGKDLDNADVEPGTYNLFATATDDLNDVVVVEGLGRITVAEEEEPPAEEGPVIDEPAEDTEFLATDDSLTIEYRVNKSEDAMADLKIDTDDDHTNGNEVTILSQEFVEADTDPDAFDWDGTDAAGDAVSDGIYRLLLVVSTSEGQPQTVEGEGLVFRRSADKEPLIALLTPASATTVDPGDYVTIRWRDEDPEEHATIRIVIDNDSDPAGNDHDQIEILAGREAKPDGVQDTFAWQVPNSLAPGTYYVMAYINHGGSGNSSVAPAPVIVRDPANP
jgi:hypothetical protein